jgi:hypothetical protein
MAQSKFSFEGFLGGAFNFGSTLSLRQEGEPDINIDADWETRPFELPPYYSLRIAFHRDRAAWEVQFTHHKIYLQNVTEDVEQFEITHGFNMLTANYAWTSLPVDIRIGGGVVIAHPDSTVRGQKSSEGYQLTGPVFLSGVGKRFDLSSHVFVSTEAQFTYGRANLPIAGGDATAPNAAIHGMIGLGFRF